MSNYNLARPKLQCLLGTCIIWSMKNILLILVFFPLLAFSELKVGDPAPDFTLSYWNTGKQFKLKDHLDKVVVLEWFSTSCPFSRRHTKDKNMVGIINKFGEQKVQWVGIDSTDPKKQMMFINYKNWLAQNNVFYPILWDPNGKVGRQYRAVVTPHIFIIYKGKIAYNGAVDDDPFGDLPFEKRKNYVELAIAGLLKDGKVPKGVPAKNQPYGCGVKYTP